MADTVDPSASGSVPPPPPVSTTQASESSSPNSEPSTLDLPPNIAAAIACIPLIGGIIFYLLEKRNAFVRFYAMQSIIFGGAWFLLGIVLKIMMTILLAVPVIGWFFAVLLGILWVCGWLAFCVIFLITVIKAFMGKRWEIPFIGPLARQQMQGGTP